MKNFLKGALIALLATTGMVGNVLAEYPQRPVTIIEPWPPGDVDDQLVRVIAEEFTKQTGVPAKVVNRPGGYGVEGAQSVLSSAADGYTVGNFLVDIPTSYIIQGIAPFAREDMEVVGLNMNFPFILAAKKDAPYNNLAELAEYAKKNPVKLAHFGFETIPAQQTFEAARQLGFKFSTETGYDATDCTTLANGDADVMNSTVGLVLACKDDIKVLAAYTEKPISVFPEAPLLRDQITGPTFALWSGLFVPKGTPQEVKDLLGAIAEKAMMSEQVKQISATTGAEVYWQGSAEAQARIDKDFEAVKDLFSKMKK
ncbi:tripartite tricarboxylate transporter substrate binding protein [Rhizobium laguerreae]|uniref:Tripartite-type tricarboxylate transporter receptor subunit TctC n=1 Tax=Rhizobium laguerreae TaxID=1076926 RepID=A0ABR6GAG0_9HYPH|nr:tripartite tricarboxylate transporter substrate binding protein [Rhizobium laguerreae]MBB3163264.1 tripartite-type tricarboxylate transporter receptor subunit TctC [Rhizobium laguerreae]MBY3082294.1 tripartite tricarboxylate transporter substrate binding protein [Rhizobium laguerreae]MBY3087950.1 tripartite tricarboxylate transporter substrate binding protein [Rhizobium laguerreae]MBY3116264.1 tripartite tricarboxylate transporter substrate binding protein [Rhizobium laguerreae]MBY3143707.1